VALEARIKKLETVAEARERAQAAKRSLEERSQRVQEAVCSTYTWVRQYTQTFNEHWVEEGRPSAYEPFPDEPYLAALFDILESDEKIIWIEKSRDLMVSWACVAYLILKAMTTAECGVLFQTQKEAKAAQLVNYAKCLYRRQEPWLKDAFPLTKPIEQQPALSVHFAHGGYVLGIPGGADQIRSYHPWGYLNDESSFQPEAGECYTEALPAVAGKIIFNSSAGPSWYADARKDIIRIEDD
jgi:hypothetical protein